MRHRNKIGEYMKGFTKQDLEVYVLQNELNLIKTSTEYKLAILIKDLIDERINNNESIRHESTD